MRDLGSRAAMRWGSSPHARTINQVNILQLAWFLISLTKLDVAL